MQCYRAWIYVASRGKITRQADVRQDPLGRQPYGRNERGQETSRCYGNSLGNDVSFLRVEASAVLLNTESLVPGR